MKTTKKIIYFSISSLIISFFLFLSIPTHYTFGAQVSKGECVIEVESKRVLHSENLNEKLPCASTTKILTAITVIENFDLNKVIKVPKKAVGIEGSSIYLKEGEHLSVKELLYGLMLRSGNDCADCLALSLANNYNDFISLMNSMAIKIGAKNSNFVNPHGLHDENHYTTAFDLALISAYAMQNDIFKEIVSTKKITISNEFENHRRVLVNKNKMLSNYEGCNGVKTGYTKKAGRCLVSGAERDGMQIVSVVLNSPNMWERTSEILDTAFINYKNYEVYNSNNFTTRVFKTSKGKSFYVDCYGKFSYPLTETEKNNLKFLINGIKAEEFYKNPQKNGILEIFAENKLIFSQNIFTIFV